MAGRPLSAEQQSRLADLLTSGRFRSVRALALEAGHTRRTIERFAARRGLPLPCRVIAVPAETTARAAYLLEHSRVTIAELAAAEGISKATLRRRLSAAGVRGAGAHLRRSELARIERLLDEGRTPRQVAAAVGRHSRTVQKYRAARRRRIANGGGTALAEAG